MLKDIVKDFEYIKTPVAHIPVTFIKKSIFGRTPYWRQYFWNKWGFFQKAVIDGLKNRPAVWINAISGGEVIQAVQFSLSLRKALTGYKTILSTESVDAFAYAQKERMADYVVDAPWDIRMVARRVLKNTKPRAIIFIENAYYPVLLREARRNGIKNILISGRMNEVALEGQMVTRRAREMGFFRHLDAIGAKSEKDMENFIRLGCDARSVCVLGDLRYDLLCLRMSGDEREIMRNRLGFSKKDGVFMAGSVHEAEFRIVVDAFCEARKNEKNLKMVIAPRWFYEISSLKKELERNILKFNLLSAGHPEGDFDVLIMDTFGDLAKMYGAADIVYIGNSIIPINERRAGHSLIEPLVHGRPVLFGRSMNAWRDMTDKVKKICPDCEVKDAKDLAHKITRFINDGALAAKLYKLGEEATAAHAGSADRYVGFIKGKI